MSRLIDTQLDGNGDIILSRNDVEIARVDGAGNVATKGTVNGGSTTFLNPSGGDDTSVLSTALATPGGTTHNLFQLGIGTFNVSAQLASWSATPSDIHIKGMGRSKTIINLTADLGVGVGLFTGAGTSLGTHLTKVTFEDITFQFNSHTGDLFQFTAASLIRLIGLYGLNVVGSARRFTEVWDSYIEDCHWEACGDAANDRAVIDYLSVDTTNQNTSTNNIKSYGERVEGQTYIGVRLQDQTIVCDFDSLKVHGTNPNPAGYDGIQLIGATECVFDKPRITNIGGNGITIQNGTHNTKGGNTVESGRIDGCGAGTNATATAYGVNIVDSPSNRIDIVSGFQSAHKSGDINDASAFTSLANRNIIVPSSKLVTNTDYMKGASAQVALANDVFIPSAYLAQTYPRFQEMVTGIGLTTGTLFLTAVWLQQGMKIQNISYFSGGTAFVAGASNAKWFALFNAGRVMVAVTADDGSTAWGTNAEKKLAIATVAAGAASSYTVPTTGLYYVGIMVQTNGTMPTVTGMQTNAAGTAGPFSLAPVLNGSSSTGQTTPPAFAFTAAALTVVGGTPYAALS